MAEQLGKPVEGVAFINDITRTNLSKMEGGRGVAKKLATTDHADGRYVVGLGSKPVLVQKNADDLTFRSHAEQLIIDGTAAVMAKLSSTDSVSAPIEGIDRAAPMPGDPVPERAAMQPQAPQSIVAVPVAQPSFPQGALTLDKAAVSVPAKQVIIEGSGIGKMRVWCQDVIVSEKLVVLVYGLTSSIVEPPESGPDSLLSVKVGKDQYNCASLGMSVEYQGALLVLLVRV